MEHRVDEEEQTTTPNPRGGGCLKNVPHEQPRSVASSFTYLFALLA